MRILHGYAEPYATLTIADILGVPESDHDKFRGAFSNKVIGSIDGSTYEGGHVNALDEWFIEYVEDRRRQPGDEPCPSWRTAPSPTVRCLRSSRPSVSPPCSSPPGGAPPCTCSPPPCSSSPRIPTCRTGYARTGANPKLH